MRNRWGYAVKSKCPNTVESYQKYLQASDCKRRPSRSTLLLRAARASAQPAIVPFEGLTIVSKSFSDPCALPVGTRRSDKQF